MRRGCIILYICLFLFLFLSVLECVNLDRNWASNVLQDFPLFWPEDESTYDDMITVRRLSTSSSSVDNLKANYDQAQIAEKMFRATDLRVSYFMR